MGDAVESWLIHHRRTRVGYRGNRSATLQLRKKCHDQDSNRDGYAEWNPALTQLGIGESGLHVD